LTYDDNEGQQLVAEPGFPVVLDDIQFDRRAYDPQAAYAQSKTANSLFAVGATRRWGPDGIFTNAVNPGGVATGLQRNFTRLTIEVIGGAIVVQQRPAAGLEAERDVRAEGLGRLGEPFERAAGEFGVSRARGRLDELGQRPHGRPREDGVHGGVPRRRHRILVAGEDVVQDRSRSVRVARRQPVPSGSGLPDCRGTRTPFGADPNGGPALGSWVGLLRRTVGRGP